MVYLASEGAGLMSRKPEFPCLTLCLECKQRKPETCGVCKKCKKALALEERDGVSTKAEQIKAGRRLESPLATYRRADKQMFYRLLTAQRKPK